MKPFILVLLAVCLSAAANAALAQSVAQPGSINGDISAFRGDQNTLVNAN